MYNNQFKSGLQNYAPDCPYWGQPWAANLVGDPHYALAGAFHFRSEACSGRCFWRGYLQEANLARPEILGCPVEDFTGQPWPTG